MPAHNSCPACGAGIPGETKTCGSCGKVSLSLSLSLPLQVFSGVWCTHDDASLALFKRGWMLITGIELAGWLGWVG